MIHPDFNTLVLLDVAGPPEKPHFVSRVAPGVMRRRLALSGWYA